MINKKLTFGIFLVLLNLMTISSVTGQEEIKTYSLVKHEVKSQWVEGEVVVRFNIRTTKSDIDYLLSMIDGKVKYVAQYDNFHIVQLPDGMTVEEGIEFFKNQDNVSFVEPNYLRFIHYQPNDPYYSYQWHFHQINMESAWDISTGDSSAVVAVLDTGVAYENYGSFKKASDLVGTSFVQGWDFINNDSHANDEGGDGFGHGTFVAGVIAETTNNGVGVAGMAFNCSIMPIRVCNTVGSCPSTAIAEGIRYAADNGADVINLSLGGYYSSQVEYDAIKYAYNNGVAIVAASGNEADESDWPGDVDYPARHSEVLAVGATKYDKTLAYYSNYGQNLDVVAPGGDVNVDQNNDGYGDGILQNSFSDGKYWEFHYYFASGTSFSAPHGAALAALLVSVGLRGYPDIIYDVIRFSAEDLGTAGRDNNFGYGLISPINALRGLGIID